MDAANEPEIEANDPNAAVPNALVQKARHRLRNIGALIASVAAVGAVVSGLTGYWNAWKTVRGDFMSAPAPKPAAPALVVSKGPSVAVLPLASAGGALDAFADTMTQQLTSSLGRFSTLGITPRAVATDMMKRGGIEVAREAGVDYLVTGDVRPLGDGARANVQVSDLRSGQEIWSKSFDTNVEGLRTATGGYELGDIAAAQIGGYPGAIVIAEYKKIQSKPVVDLTPYECIVQGVVAGVFVSSSVILKARECIDALTSRQSSNALAWAVRSGVLYLQRSYGFGLSADRVANFEKRRDLDDDILSAASKAVDLAPDDPTARMRFALAVAMSCNINVLRQETDRALALNPNDAWMLGILGIHLAFQGDWDSGATMAEKAIRLVGPNAPFIWWYGPIYRHWWRGEYKEALEAFSHGYVEALPASHVFLAQTLPFLGRVDEARTEVAKVIKLSPSYTIREFESSAHLFCFPSEYVERAKGALRRAGLPE